MADIDSARRVIEPRDCDLLGHMNVSRYFEIASDGGFAIQEAIGFDRADLTAGRKLAFVVVHADSDFRREVLAGDILYQKSGILEIGEKSALFRHRQFRSSDDTLVFQSRFKCLLMDLETRKVVTTPDEVKERMQAVLADRD
jgi:acyl-CoA thioester hydrolase